MAWRRPSWRADGYGGGAADRVEAGSGDGRTRAARTVTWFGDDHSSSALRHITVRPVGADRQAASSGARNRFGRRVDALVPNSSAPLRGPLSGNVRMRG